MKRKIRLKDFFPFSARDSFITVLVLAMASAICFLLRFVSDADFHAPLIFCLAVFIISASTSGYAYGIVSSILSVFGVNYAFTYPYFAFNFSLSGYPLTILSSFVVSIITCTMTTRLRQSEKYRLESERERMRANLLRAISHDFRTPLTSIIGSINVVLEDKGSLSQKEVRSLLSDAKTDAEWLINMVENLLSITRFDDGVGYALHKETQAVEEIVGESITKFRRQYPDMKLIVDVPPELLLVPMDATLIEQVIINLLINSAIHGTGATCVKLIVRSEEEQVVFTVEDNGAGIDPELLPTLFDGSTVHRSSSHTEDSSKNMGIGLSVCNTIVNAHGGKMSAKNLPTGGASISFTLPVDKSANDIAALLDDEQESYPED